MPLCKFKLSSFTGQVAHSGLRKLFALKTEDLAEKGRSFGLTYKMLIIRRVSNKKRALKVQIRANNKKLFSIGDIHQLT
jgi:hypothetical protein